MHGGEWRRRVKKADRFPLHELVADMERYNSAVAPGSESEAWGLFVEDCRNRLATEPGEDGLDEVICPLDFWNYWTAVAAGKHPDFVAATGASVA